MTGSTSSSHIIYAAPEGSREWFTVIVENIVALSDGAPIRVIN